MTDDVLTLLLGDCRTVMAEMPECSVDAIVTDPPYGIGFMGKAWDHSFILERTSQRMRQAPIPDKKPRGRDAAAWTAGTYDRSVEGNRGFQVWCELWGSEALRILKPGASIVVFGSPRTYHRLAAGLEDAGFEIRDCLMYMFGSGFPKSLDVSKAIDKAAGAQREVVADGPYSSRRPRAVAETNVDGAEYGFGAGHSITAPATDLAREWQGWGTALKPAFEPVILAVKPDTKWAIIGSCLSTLLASIAAQLSASSQSVYAQPGSVPQRVARLLSTLADSSDQTDTWLSDRATASSLNIASSWLSTWEDLSNDGSMFTTVTRSSLTTELKTLSFLLSELTPSIMLQAVTSTDGCPALVSSVDALFSAAAQKLSATRSLSALGLVTEQGHISLPDEGALKPDFTPIILARKPLIGTVAANVLAYGTGALNIDGCRIEGVGAEEGRSRHGGGLMQGAGSQLPDSMSSSPSGRWPANVLLDTEAARQLDAMSGERPGNSNENLYAHERPEGDWSFTERGISGMGRGDSGGASRFFYTAKTSRSEREFGLDDLEPTRRSDGREKDIENPRLRTNERRNDHPTVKPVDLMAWLCRLVTPPGGLILDPFLGSGSTGMAALDEGFRFVGIDLDEHYLEIAKRRIERRHLIDPMPAPEDGHHGQAPLF